MAVLRKDGKLDGITGSHFHRLEVLCAHAFVKWLRAAVFDRAIGKLHYSARPAMLKRPGDSISAGRIGIRNPSGDLNDAGHGRSPGSHNPARWAGMDAHRFWRQ